MRFVQKTDNRGNNEVKFDVADLGLDHENIEIYLTFKIATFTKLTRNKVKANEFVTPEEIWNKTFLPVNNFFHQQPIEIQQRIAMTIIEMHSDIIKFMSKNDMSTISKFSQMLGEKVVLLEKETDLCRRLTEFVETSIPIGDCSKVGKRAQDVRELTWLRDDVVNLTTVIVLCKMLTPIFGVFMGHIRTHMDNRLKEIHCAAILNLLFRTKYYTTIMKLRHYIEHFVKNELKEDDTAVFHGNTDFTLSYYIFDSLISRSFINANLNFPDGNIMTLILATVKHAVETQHTNMHKTPYRIRQPLGDGADENKDAQHEIDSMSSMTTADTVNIVVASIPEVIRAELDLNELDVDDYLEYIAYYEKHPIVPTDFNKQLNCLYFGPKLGGAKSILMLQGISYYQLTALLQMILFSYKHYELGHMVTATPALEAKMVQTRNDDIIKMNYSVSPSYNICRTRYVDSPFGANGKVWDEQVNKLVDILMRMNFIYNTAPKFWDDLQLPNFNGSMVQNSKALMDEFCTFADTTLTFTETAQSMAM